MRVCVCVCVCVYIKPRGFGSELLVGESDGFSARFGRLARVRVAPPARRQVQMKAFALPSAVHTSYLSVPFASQTHSFQGRGPCKHCEGQWGKRSRFPSKGSQHKPPSLSLSLSLSLSRSLSRSRPSKLFSFRFNLWKVQNGGPF